MKSWVLALAILTAAAPAVAAPQTITAAEKSVVDAAVVRGRLIYALDMAAAYASDLAQEKIPKARQGEVRGWIVEPKGDLQTVTFYGMNGDAPYAVFVAEMRLNKTVSSRLVGVDEPRDFNPVQARMAQARNVVKTVKNAPGCAKSGMNTVVIPPPTTQAAVEIYLLTPQVAQGEFPFGGHYLVTVTPDDAVKSVRPFAKSCLTMASPPNAASAMVTHLLDPTPTEIHVWLANWMGMDVFVGIYEPQRLWRVRAGEITLVPTPAR